MPALYVQYGCGWRAPCDWLNFDASPTLRYERIPIVGRLYTRNKERFPVSVRYGDIVSGLPVACDSCAGIYACHVLEHLSLAECRRALLHTRSYLRLQGIFRLVVPDMEALCRQYLARLEQGDADAVCKLMRDSWLGYELRPSGILKRVVASLSNAHHLWMWDYLSLSKELQIAGFAQIRRCYYGDCEDEAFRSVEEASRFAGCLGVECRKIS